MTNISLFKALALIIGWCVTAVWAEEDDDHHDEESVLALTVTQREAAGVRIGKVTARRIGSNLVVPGEITLNGYETGLVSPRVSAQVTARLARLGDRVQPGDPLVELSSVDIAIAQGTFIEAASEWTRVQELGSTVVSAKRFTEAQVAHQRARAALEAFGLAAQAIAALTKPGGAAFANGAFTLNAPLAGTVMEDDVLIGAFVKPGRVLFRISNEQSLWVEASLPASTRLQFEPGDPAWVIRGDESVEATVVQDHHALNERTRRRQLRLELPNPDDAWHPGEFVEVALFVSDSTPRLAVPSAALAMLEGESMVFVWDGDAFAPMPVKTRIEGNGWTAIEGLPDGTAIATDGVYHLKSLLLRSTIGEGHAH